jgi:hypothetical protein
MHVFVEILCGIIEGCADWVVWLVLERFGYDRSSEPVSLESRRRNPVLSGLICLLVILTVLLGLGGLVWLGWRLRS